MTDIVKLLELMRKLRDPVDGCPWDVQQDFHTIAPYTIEEAYEVADAIVREDMQELRDELGDLLFQVVFHAQMASEAGAFSFNDVVTAIVDKMTRRHPHVFDRKQYASIEEQKADWDQIKSQERQSKGHVDHSRFDDVPAKMPALKRAQKLTKKASKVGFDWPDADAVFDKLHEEIEELREAMQHDDQDHVREEMGDLLFVCANLARKLELDADRALREANQKFIKRFDTMERLASDDGHDFESLPLNEQDAYWNAAKKVLKKT